MTGLTVNKNDKFMVEIVLRVLNNSMYKDEGRELSDVEIDQIVALWNEFGFGFNPSVDEIFQVWNEL